MGLNVFSNRAAVPSIKSKIAARPMRYAVYTNSPLNVKYKAIQPQIRFEIVSRFGMCFDI